MPKLKTILKAFGPNEMVYVIIWDQESEEKDGPIYEGLMCNIPYWLAECRLAEIEKDEDYAAISFRDSLGSEYKNRPGLVITIAIE